MNLYLSPKFRKGMTVLSGKLSRVCSQCFIKGTHLKFGQFHLCSGLLLEKCIVLSILFFHSSAVLSKNLSCHSGWDGEVSLQVDDGLASIILVLMFWLTWSGPVNWDVEASVLEGNVLDQYLINSLRCCEHIHSASVWNVPENLKSVSRP